ncbi:GPI mannosyltransferase 1 [Plasmodium brasilianum]|uniref:GPI mannosyltransferase 1 n=1 Tax=Plasmodium brasilianum TaxID=5824 RepID=A0ACB9Y3T2_PLABR|nr:GPI mannosyltransferase 1 [Plasmodium brasilianum]
MASDRLQEQLLNGQINNDNSCKYINNTTVFTRLIYILGILIRLVIYYYGLWQDNNLDVKFTDIDYYVFSDAARYVLNNKSPYNRYTYRYTPLLAYLMLPNIFIHFSFGKILFSSIDLLVSIIIIKIIKIKYPECKNYIFYVYLWILNPLVIIISLRGNSDSIPCLFVLLTILCIYQKKICLSAIFYGYGRKFLYESFIYHLVRRDHRHNFSLFFYIMYLSIEKSSKIIPLIIFVPQVILVGLFGFKYAKVNLELSMFLQVNKRRNTVPCQIRKDQSIFI